MIIFLAVALVCLAAAWYWYNKPREGIENKTTQVAIPAELLYEGYNRDEAAADKEFLNKVIEVKGKVNEIIINGNDAVLMMGINANGSGISCLFSPAGQLESAKLQKGMEVVVKGKCTGFNIDVNLTDCIIIL
ncbi:MAG TPA: hypothetical protein VFV68_15425 [Agriterribacter sp.]|nr:hypothetical protein [Agriterribacter sp.]